MSESDLFSETSDEPSAPAEIYQQSSDPEDKSDSDNTESARIPPEIFCRDSEPDSDTYINHKDD